MQAAAPSAMPHTTIHLSRILAALSSSSSNESVGAALASLYDALWVQHLDVSQPDHYLPLLTRAVGADAAQEAVALAPTMGKELLLLNTEDAVADGAFGLPWMVCGNARGECEAFWGVDHLGLVVEFLGVERPRIQRGWKAVL